jgi:hypothetical protein
MIYLSTFAALALAYGAMHRMRLRTTAACVAALVLATVAALRGPDVASDYLVYEDWYQWGLDSTFVERALFFESLYFSISELLSQSEVPFRVFLWLLAAISVYVKASVIIKFSSRSRASALALLIYAVSFYLLHDFTQIRAGVAIALLFAALWARANDRLWQFFMLTLLATGFHTSAILALLFALPADGRLARAIDIAILSVTVTLLGLALLGQVPAEQLITGLSQLDPRLSLYVERSTSFESDAANPFSIPSLLALGTALSLFLQLRFRASSHRVDRRDILALVHFRRSVLIGICCLVSLYPFREISLRIYEISIAFIPIAAAVVFSRPRMLLTKSFILLWAAATAYVYIFREDPLVQPYMIALQ